MQSISIPTNKFLESLFGYTGSKIIQQIHFNLLNTNITHEGKKWVIKPAKTLADELGRSERTIKQNIKKLEDIGVLVSGVYNNWKWNRTKWYCVDYDKLKELLLDSHDLQLIAQNKSNPNDKLVIDYTLKSVEFPESEDMQIQKNPPELIKSTKKITKANSVADILNKEKETANTPFTFYKGWVSLLPKYHKALKFIAPFTMKEKGIAKHIKKVWETDGSKLTEKPLQDIVANWVLYADYIKKTVGLYKTPDTPNLLFMNKHIGLIKSFYMLREEKELKIIKKTGKEKGTSEDAPSSLSVALDNVPYKQMQSVKEDSTYTTEFCQAVSVEQRELDVKNGADVDYDLTEEELGLWLMARMGKK